MTQPDVSPPNAAAPRRRRPSRLPYALAVLGLAAVIAAAWIGRGRFEPVIAGSPAPGFEVHSLDGAALGLDAYRGKVVLLNVWATWCAPCREEMPSMQRLYEGLAGKDFEIVAVSVDDLKDGALPKQSLEAFGREFGLSFPIVHSDPASDGNIQKIYRTTGVPESFLIGRDGVIYRRISGPTSWDAPEYREQILRLLGE